MSLLVEADMLVTGRLSATAVALMRKRFTPETDGMDWEFENYVDASRTIDDMDPADPALELDLTNLTGHGNLLILRSLDEDGALVPILLYVNGSGTDPLTGSFFIVNFDDTTGITSLHVKNLSGDTVYISYFVGGDLVTT